MTLSQEAEQFMKDIATEYKKEWPNHKVWMFEKGKDGPVHAELKARGLIELHGTRGAPYRLTDAGRDWVHAAIDG